MGDWPSIVEKEGVVWNIDRTRGQKSGWYYICSLYQVAGYAGETRRPGVLSIVNSIPMLKYGSRGRCPYFGNVRSSSGDPLNCGVVCCGSVSDGTDMGVRTPSLVGHGEAFRIRIQTHGLSDF